MPAASRRRFSKRIGLGRGHGAGGVTSGHHSWPGRDRHAATRLIVGFHSPPGVALRSTPGYSICAATRLFVGRFRGVLFGRLHGGLLGGSAAVRWPISRRFVGRFASLRLPRSGKTWVAGGGAQRKPPVMMRRCDLSRASGGALHRGSPCRIAVAFNGVQSPRFRRASRSDVVMTNDLLGEVAGILLLLCST